MANIDHNDEKLLPEDLVHNAVTPHPAGIESLEPSPERFALIGIHLERVQDIRKTLVQFPVQFRHATKHGCGLLGKFQFIFFQGNA